MARLHLFSWELLELSTLNTRCFFVPAAAILFEQIEHRPCNCLRLLGAHDAPQILEEVLPPDRPVYLMTTLNPSDER